MRTDFASSDLSGKTIGKWKVGDRIENNDTTTKYSLFYHVEDKDGGAIMKVLDTEKCNRGDKGEGLSRTELISRESSAFHYETKVAKACVGRHMSNVIRYIDSGEVEFEDYTVPTVTFIVYEQSEGRIGDFIKFSSTADFVADLGMLVDKLKSLHQVTKGVKQLHTNAIAHHNITPQSVEVFDDNRKYKLGALHTSKSDQNDLISPVGRLLFNGDLTYAPPEAFFDYRIPDTMSSYYQIDTYMLGNLVVYYLTQLSMTTLLNQHLPYSLKEWASHSADYVAVLPEITNAFEAVLKNIKSSICVEELQAPIIEIISCLCNPDPERRGYPGGFKDSRTNADLQRVLTKLDVLYNQAQQILAKNYLK